MSDHYWYLWCARKRTAEGVGPLHPCGNPHIPFCTLKPAGTGGTVRERATDCCRLTDRRLTTGPLCGWRQSAGLDLTRSAGDCRLHCPVSVSVTLSGPLSSATGPAFVLAHPSSTPKWGTEDAEMKSPHIRIQSYHSLSLSLECFAYSLEFCLSFYSTSLRNK